MTEQSKRVLVLTDDELLLIVSWGEVAQSGVAHDFEDEDEELLAKIEAARLR